MGVSSRRPGVGGFDRDGELYAKSRRLVGVVGITEPDAWRVGETARVGEGGVTSVVRIDAKMELACSFCASDSVGMILFLDGVAGGISSRS